MAKSNGNNKNGVDGGLMILKGLLTDLKINFKEEEIKRIYDKIVLSMRSCQPRVNAEVLVVIKKDGISETVHRTSPTLARIVDICNS
ncbi:MAG: hypothetical protein UW72_C0007G0032 [Parcubacteria group bacterium GW2011_GWF2_44_7]|nr:MAG: hypothetical protein UW72_C0007G0032 [Parcubacteria group bacterium GW2011_GWF2_44_7]